MKKLYTYYLEPNRQKHSIHIHGIHIKHFNNHNLITNIYVSPLDNNIIMTMDIANDSPKKIQINLDPDLFQNNPKIFMEIFNEKLRKL